MTRERDIAWRLRKQAAELRGMDLTRLMDLALETKLAGRGSQFALCSIINAKSGQCSEDCHFCVQSAHFVTQAPVYPFVDRQTILAAARQAKDSGAEHFSIVTSGRGLGRSDLRKVADCIAAIRAEVPIQVCASLGILTASDFRLLKEAGLTRYHHNLEAGKEFFPRVVTTHGFQDRINTIRAARAAGIEVCAGGIFGLGESEDDRISMAISLAEEEVDSVPLNILIPLPGTPLASQPPIPVAEVLRSIAIYRLLMPGIPVRLAAGRETVLQDFLSAAFLGGADGMMIGGYLTERGRPPSKDLAFMREMVAIWEERMGRGQ